MFQSFDPAGFTKVRFEFSEDHNTRIYYQPIFYIAENYKQHILKHNENPTFDTLKYDIELSFPNFETASINLQGICFEKDKVKGKINYHYVFDRITESDLYFQYKGADFWLNVKKETNGTPIALSRQNNTLLTYFTIKFRQSDYTVFEEFLTTAKKYHDRYLLNDENDENNINMYVNCSEGSYFSYVGSRPKRSLNTVYLPSKQKQTIIDDLTNFLKPETKQRYAKLGINYKRTYLFEGVPGSGKTSFILALASQFDYDVSIISFGPKITDIDLVHLLRNMNDRGDETKRKTFLILEDMDCIFKERKSNDEQRNCITFSGLLNALDGLFTPDNLICFITTNYKSHLDGALIRPGRIDYIMKFDYVIKEQVIDIFNVYMSNPDSAITANFFTALKGLNIKVTVSLLQQYLLKYVDMPDEAIKNIEELKKMNESSIIEKSAEDTGLFS